MLFIPFKVISIISFIWPSTSIFSFKSHFIVSSKYGPENTYSILHLPLLLITKVSPNIFSSFSFVSLFTLYFN